MSAAQKVRSCNTARSMLPGLFACSGSALPRLSLALGAISLNPAILCSWIATVGAKFWTKKSKVQLSSAGRWGGGASPDAPPAYAP